MRMYWSEPLCSIYLSISVWKHWPQSYLLESKISDYFGMLTLSLSQIRFSHCWLLFSDTVHSSSAYQIYMDGWQNLLSVSLWKGNSNLQWQTLQSCSFIYWSCQQMPCSFWKLGTNVTPKPLATDFRPRILLSISRGNQDCFSTAIL